MLRLKKPAEAAAPAGAPSSATAASTAAEGGSGTAADAAGAAKKISLLGGDEARRSGAAAGPAKKKLQPGEIRVQKDIAELDGGSVAKVTWPDPKDLTSMLVVITPDQGLWKGASFEFSIKVPDMYPHQPPKVHCNTKIYHPNIDLAGHVCLNILRDEWKPVFDINTVIYGIIYLFYEPNPNDPLNHEAAALFRDNKEQFQNNVNSSLRGGRVGSTTFPRLL